MIVNFLRGCRSFTGSVGLVLLNWAALTMLSTLTGPCFLEVFAEEAVLRNSRSGALQYLEAIGREANEWPREFSNQESVGVLLWKESTAAKEPPFERKVLSNAEFQSAARIIFDEVRRRKSSAQAFLKDSPFDRWLASFGLARERRDPDLQNLEDAILQLVDHYLKWSSDDRRFDLSFAISDFQMDEDKSLKEIFKIQKEGDSLLRFICEELLFRNDLRRILVTNVYESLFRYDFYVRVLMKNSEDTLFKKYQSFASSKLADDLVTYEEAERFVKATKAKIDEVRKFSESGGGNDSYDLFGFSQLEVFRPIFVERLSNLVHSNNGILKRGHFREAFNLTPAETLIFLKRQQLFKEFKDLERQDANLRLREGYSTNRKLLWNRSLEQVFRSRQKVLKAQLDLTSDFTPIGIDEHIQKSLKDYYDLELLVDDTIDLSREPAIGGFNSVADNAEDLRLVREYLLHDARLHFRSWQTRDFGLEDAGVKPDEIRFRTKPGFGGATQTQSILISYPSFFDYLPTEAKKNPRYYSDAEWKGVFEVTLKRIVDERLKQVSEGEFILPLKGLIADGTRYGPQGFLFSGRESKNSKWLDPIIERWRQPHLLRPPEGKQSETLSSKSEQIQKSVDLELIDFDREARPKYNLALTAVALGSSRQGAEYLLLSEAHLLSWSENELRQFLLIRSVVPDYGEGLIRNQGRPDLDGLKRDAHLVTRWRDFLESLGLKSKGIPLTFDWLKAHRADFTSLLSEKEALASGVPLNALGCFDGKFEERRKQWLSYRELKPLLPNDFNELLNPPDSKLDDFKGSGEEVLKNVRDCLALLRAERDAWAIDLKRELLANSKGQSIPAIENLVRLRFLVEEALTKKPVGSLETPFFERIERVAPYKGENDSVQAINARLNILREGLEPKDLDLNREINQILLEILEVDSQTRQETQGWNEIYQRMQALMSPAMREVFIKTKSLSGVFESMGDGNATFSGISFNQFPWLELDALRFLVKRYGWRIAIDGNETEGALNSLLIWLARNGLDKASGEGVSIAFDVEALLNLLNMAESAQRAELILPSLWGKNWRSNLFPNDEPVNLLLLSRHVNTNLPRVLQTIYLEQRRAAQMFTFDSKRGCFRVPKELRETFEADYGSLKRLGVWKIPLDEDHLNYLRSLGAVQYFNTVVRPQYNEYLASFSKEKRQIKQKALEADKDKIPEPLIRYWEKRRNLPVLFKTVGDMQWSGPEQPFRSLYSARQIEDLQLILVKLIQTGLRSHDALLQDFFGEEQSQDTKTIWAIFLSKEDPLKRALRLMGYRLSSPGLEMALQLIQRDNRDLYRELREVSSAWMDVGELFINSLKKGDGLKAVEIRDILLKIYEDPKIADLVFGTLQQSPNEGLRISKSKVNKILEALKLDLKKTPEGEERDRDQQNHIIEQIQWLRPFLTHSQTLFSDFSQGRSNLILAYAIPILLRQMESSTMSDANEETIFSDPELVPRLVKERLKQFQEFLPIDLSSDFFVDIFSQAHLSGRYSFAQVDSDFRGILGHLFDAYRIAFGEGFDSLSIGFRVGDELGLVHQTRGGVRFQEMAERLESVRQRLVDDIVTLENKLDLKEEQQIDAQWISLRNTLLQSVATLQHSVQERIFPISERYKEDALGWRKATFNLRRLMSLVNFHQIPLSFHTGPNRMFIYESRLVPFMEKWRRLSGTEEDRMGPLILNILKTRMSEKKGLGRPLRQRLQAFGELLQFVKAGVSISPEPLAQLLDEAYEEGIFDPEDLMQTIAYVVKLRFSRFDPRDSRRLSEDHIRLSRQLEEDVQTTRAIINVLIKSMSGILRGKALASHREVVEIFSALEATWNITAVSIEDSISRKSKIFRIMEAVAPHSEKGSTTLEQQSAVIELKNNRRTIETISGIVSGILSDPLGLDLHLESRYAPYAHKPPILTSGLSETERSFAINREIRRKLIQFLGSQKDEFFSLDQRSKSRDSMLDNVFQDRKMAVVLAAAGASIDIYQHSLHLLGNILIFRKKFEAEEGERIENKKLWGLLEIALKESKPNTQTQEEDRKWITLLKDEKWLENNLFDEDSSQSLRSSPLVHKQIAQLQEVADSLEALFVDFGQIALSKSPLVARQALYPGVAAAFTEFSRSEMFLGMDFKAISDGLIRLNKYKMKMKYENFIQLRDFRAREDRGYLKGFLLVIVDFAQSAAMTTISPFHGILELASVHLASLLMGDEAFEKAVAYFGEMRGSYLSEEMIEGPTIHVVSRLAMDGLSLFLPMVKFGVGRVGQDLITNATKRSIQGLVNKGVVRAATVDALVAGKLANPLLNSVAVGGRRVVTEFAKWRSVSLGMRPSDTTMLEALKSFSKSHIMDGEFANVARSRLWMDFHRETLKQVGKALSDPKNSSQVMKDWFVQAWPIIKVYGANFGLNGAFLAGLMVAASASQDASNKSAVETSEQFAKSLADNIKIFSAFLVTGQVLRHWPLLQNVFSTGIMNDIMGHYAQNLVESSFYAGDSRWTHQDLILNSWMAALSVVGFEERVGRPLYERFVSLGDLEKLKHADADHYDEIIRLIKEDPEAFELQKEYQRGMNARIQAIVGTGLTLMILGGPWVGRVFEANNIKNWERESRSLGATLDPSRSSISETLAMAYGQNPQRIWNGLLQRRIEFLRTQPSFGARSEGELRALAIQQLQGRYWSYYVLTDPALEVAAQIASWKMRGQEVEMMRPYLITHLKTSHERLMRGERGFLVGKDVEQRWNDFQAKMHSGINRGIEWGDLGLSLFVSHLNGWNSTAVQALLMTFQTAMNELAKPQSANTAPQLVIENVFRKLGLKDMLEKPEGQMVLRQILLPRLREMERQADPNNVEPKLSQSILGIDFNINGQGPQLRAGLEAIDKVLGDAKGPAFSTTVPHSKGSRTEFTTVDGRSLGVLEISENRRFYLPPQDGAQPSTVESSRMALEIPAGVEFKMLGSGRIVLEKLGSPSWEGSPLAGFPVDALNTFQAKWTRAPQLVSELPKADVGGFQPRLRIAEIWADRQTKVAVMMAEMGPGLEFFYMPNGNIAIRSSGRSIVLPGGWEFKEFREGILRIEDRFGVATTLDFPKNEVRFWERVNGVLVEVTVFNSARNGSPMTLPQMQKFMVNFHGLLPTEMLRALALRQSALSQPVTQSIANSAHISESFATRSRDHLMANLGMRPTAERFGPSDAEVTRYAYALKAQLSGPREVLGQEARGLVDQVKVSGISHAQMIQTLDRQALGSQFMGDATLPSLARLKTEMARSVSDAEVIPRLPSYRRDISDLSVSERAKIEWEMLVHEATPQQLHRALTASEIEGAFRLSEARRMVDQNSLALQELLKTQRLEQARALLEMVTLGDESQAFAAAAQQKKIIVEGTFQRAQEPGADARSRMALEYLVPRHELVELYVKDVDAIGRGLGNADFRNGMIDLGRRSLEQQGRPLGGGLTADDFIREALKGFSSSTILAHLGADRVVPLALSRLSLLQPHEAPSWLLDRFRSVDEALQIIVRQGQYP